MADVAPPARIAQQVALITGLRWRLFRNSLRTASGKFDLLALMATSFFGGLFVLGTGAGLAYAAHALVLRNEVEYLWLPLLGAFLFWQAAPLMLATSAAGFDFRNLLRFPLRFSAFYFLSAVYALADPAALGSLFWLACIAAGIVAARADLLPWTLLVLGAYALMNLLLSRMVFTWLERLLARRRSREAFFAIFMALLLCAQFSGMIAQRLGPRTAKVLLRFLSILEYLPPGTAGKALAGAIKGHALNAIGLTGLLLGYALACGLLLRSRLRAQYRGEDLGESPAPTAAAQTSTAVVAEPAHDLSFATRVLPGTAAAILEKEVRYLIRNSAMWLFLVLPIALTAVFVPSLFAPRRGAGFFSRSPEFLFPAAVAYMFLVLAQNAHNIFAYEGRGIQLLFVAPVRFRDVLLGKNLLFGFEVGVEALVVWVVIGSFFRAPGAAILISTFSALAFATLVHVLVGNWLSLQFPRRYEFGQQRRRPSQAAVFIGLGAQSILAGIIAVVMIAARFSGQAWIFPVALLILSGLALWAYWATLEHYGRYALDRREELAARLCK